MGCWRKIAQLALPHWNQVRDKQRLEDPGELLHGARNYGGIWEDAYYSKINGECVLGGLISKGSSWEVAQLPSTCRPEKALMFNVNNHQCTMRLDIYTDGKIKAITGGCHAWVSLSGVSFIPKDSKSSSSAFASSLKSGWVPSGSFWEAPSYTLVDGECLVQGFIHGGSWGHIATLPVECRPYKRLIFNLNNHQYTSRVDVLPDGRVYWVGGGRSHGWLSLTESVSLLFQRMLSLLLSNGSHMGMSTVFQHGKCKTRCARLLV